MDISRKKQLVSVQRQVAVQVACALALYEAVAPGSAWAQTAKPNNIVTDGRTGTSQSINGRVTDIRTTTVSGANAFNSFSTFNVGAGQVVNLHLPTSSANLINMVRDQRTTIDGILNSIKNGRIGGNVYFANPEGFLISASGVVNVGSLTLSTPTRAFVDNFFVAPGAPNEAAVTQLLAGTAPRSGTGIITIDGQVNASAGVTLHAGSINVGGSIYSGARFVGAAPNFTDVVNANGLASGTRVVERNGRIEIVADNDVTVAGTIAAPGSAGVRGGNIIIRAGNDLALQSGANVMASGDGADSAGGIINMYASNNAVTRHGALVDASAGSSGNGGAIEFSAKNNIELAGGAFRADVFSGARGSILIDPASITVSANILRGAGGYGTLPSGGTASGADLTLLADDSITVNENVIVSSRRVASDPDHVNGASIGNSGNITFTAPNITMKAGSQVLAHADTAFGFAGGDVTFTASKGATTNILGFRQADASIQIGDAAGGAIIRGRNVSLTASTEVATKWIYDNANWVDNTVNVATTTAEATVGLLASLVGLQLVHSQAVGNASVVIKGGSQISATEDVTLRAENTTTAGVVPSTGFSGPGTLVPTPLGLGAMYVRNKSDANVTVESGATISAQGLTVRAHNTATVEAQVAAADAGRDTGTIAIAVGYVTAEVQAKASVAAGANLNVSGNLSVVATNVNNFGNSVEAQTGASGVGAAAVAVSDFKASATAELNANVRDATRIEVLAVNDNQQNVTSANSRAGQTLNQMIQAGVEQKMQAVSDPAGALESFLWDQLLAGQEPDAKVKPKSTPFRIGGAVSYATSTADATAKVGDNTNLHASDSIIVGARTIGAEIQIAAESSAVSQSKDRAAANTARNSFSAGVAIGTYEHNALTKVGSGATLTASQVGMASDINIPVRESLLTGGTFQSFDRWTNLSTLKDWFDTISDGVSSITSIFDVFNGASAAKSTTDGSSGSVALSGSVTIAQFKNNARAVVDTNAKLNLTGSATGSWTRSFEVVPDDPATTGANNNEQVLQEWNFAAPAHVRADQDATLLFHGGHFVPKIGGSSSVGLGIAYTQSAITGNTEAILREGAIIQGVNESASADPVGQRAFTVTATRTTAEAQVTAESKDFHLSIASAGGQGDSFGVNGAASIITTTNNTRALVDNEATIKADKFSVTATDTPVAWSIAGSITAGKQGGVGIGIGYNKIAADTHAKVADNDTYQGELAAARASQLTATGSILSGDVNVIAHSGGHVETIAVTGATAVSSANDSGTGFFGSIKDKYEAIQSKLVAFVDQKPTSTSKSGGSSQGTAAQPKFGLSAAGSGAVNEADLTTEALIDGITIDQNTGGGTHTLTVRGIGDVDMITASGAAALTRANTPTQNKSAAITGSVAVNMIDNSTTAILRNTRVDNAGDVTVQALQGGEQLSVAIGAAINASSGNSTQNSFSLTGSLSLSFVDNSRITGLGIGSDVDVTAYNRTFIGTGGGSLAIGGKNGAGAAVTYSDITNTVDASITNASNISNVDVVGVRAYNATEIGAGAAHALVTTTANSNALGGAVVITEITNNTTASVKGSDITALSRVDVLAQDRGADNALEQIIEPGSKRENVVAGLDYCGATTGGAATPSGNCITSVAGIVQVTPGGGSNNIGLSFNWSQIHNNLTAKTENANVAVSGPSGAINVKSESNATITSFAVGVGVADKTSAAGSVAVNIIENNVIASATSTDPTHKTLTANTVTIDAKDKSRIDTLAGQITVSMNGAAVGAAVAYSEIDNDAIAKAEAININAANSATLSSENDSRIRSLAAAGSVVTGGSQPAVSASISVNFIGNTTASTVDNSAIDDGAGGTNAVTLKAEDKSTIQSLAGSVSISGTSAAAGGAFAFNSIQNAVTASLENSTVNRAATLDITAKETSVIDNITAAVGGGQTVAISGSVSLNHLGQYSDGVSADEDGNVATAEINGSTVANAATAVNVTAQDTSTIRSLAGAVSISIGSAAVGGAVADNATRNVAKASVSESSIQGAASLNIEGKNTSTIESLSLAAGGASTGAFAGSASSNRATNRTIAEIAQSEVTGSSANTTVTALDTTTIKSLAGAAAAAGSAAIGARHFGQPHRERHGSTRDRRPCRHHQWP